MILLLGFSGCFSGRPIEERAEPGKASGDPRIRVVATVGMVADLVDLIGGDSVEVRQLLGSGVDPHLYRPTRDDAILIRDAEVVFYCGLRLEGKMSELLGRRQDHGRTVAVGEAIDPSKLLGDEGSDHYDPHVWMDVSMWSEASTAIYEALAALRPTKAEEFRDRWKQLTEELAQLDAYGKEVIASIPETQRVLITSHDAFRYLGRRYGIEVAGVQGISTDSEAGLRRIHELVDLIVRRRIRAVFIESSVPKDSIEAIVRGAADRGQSLEIGGPLYSDAMGDAGTYEGTYVGMLDHNLTIIARFLGGTESQKRDGEDSGISKGFRGFRP